MLPLLLLALTGTQGSQQPVKAELVASVSAAKAGEPFLAAVVLRTEPGWHVYWQNPGDSGTPTVIKWKLPEGWTAGPLMWPVPTRFAEQDAVTYGYEGATLLMAKITPSPTAKAGPSRIEADVNWLACKEACIQGSAALRLSITMMPVKSGPSRTWHDRLNAAEKAMPQPPKGWTISAQAVPGGFALKSKPPEGVDIGRGMPTFFPMDPGVIEHAEPQRFRKDEDGTFWIALKQSTFLSKRPERLRGVLVAPKGMKWKEGVDAIIVDVPLTDGDK